MASKQHFFNASEFKKAVALAIEEPCIGYDEVYLQTKKVITWLLFKKYAKFINFHDDMSSEAHINIYKEFVLKQRDMDSLKSVYNFVTIVIERAFMHFLKKMDKIKIDKEDAKQLQVMWNTDVDEKFYTRDDLLLIYNEAYSNIRFKNEKYKFCKFLLFIQIYDRRRIEFELPCCFNEQKSEIIDFLKDYVKVLHVAAVKKLTQGGLICLKKF